MCSKFTPLRLHPNTIRSLFLERELYTTNNVNNGLNTHFQNKFHYNHHMHAASRKWEGESVCVFVNEKWNRFECNCHWMASKLNLKRFNQTSLENTAHFLYFSHSFSGSRFFAHLIWNVTCRIACKMSDKHYHAHTHTCKYTLSTSSG